MSGKYDLPRLDFGSPLVATLFEIERLRADIGTGTTPPETTAELHRLFDTVMSVVSARIEGNHTTVYEAIDLLAAADSPITIEDRIQEISNIISAARFVDDLDPAEPITHSLVRELHRQVVSGLRREGDPAPGQYRTVDVGITNSAHTPPTWPTVHPEMSSLLDFANAERPTHEQMLQIALAHHRFVWIHPFRNGNGRVSRLFTYAMLRRTVFATRGHAALNPTAVFGNDRDAYLAALESADDLSEQGTVTWASFFATGIRGDLTRLVRLQDHRYVIDELVGPALNELLRSGFVDTGERAALQIVLERGVVKAGDLESTLVGSSSQRSRIIRSLIERRLLRPAAEGPRFYRLALSTDPIASRLIRRLDTLGYLPKMLSDD